MTHIAINHIYTIDPGLAGPAILATTIISVGYLFRNCVTSAYGRVIGLLSPGGAGRPTRQDMEKAQNVDPALHVRGAQGAIPTAAESIAARVS